MSASNSWLQPLLFSSVWHTSDDFFRFAASICIMVFTATMNNFISVYIWKNSRFFNHLNKAPTLLVAAASTMLYGLAILVILQFIYGQSITALAALSGATAVILGFSAQTTLGEIFSGISLSMSSPFRVGDWVKIGILDEGLVIDHTWRQIKIRTREGSIIHIANSFASTAPIKNFTRETENIKINDLIKFRQGQEQDDAYFINVLNEALLSVTGSCAISVVYIAREHEEVTLQFCYMSRDYAILPSLRNSIWLAIHQAMSRHDLSYKRMA